MHRISIVSMSFSSGTWALKIARLGNITLVFIASHWNGMARKPDRPKSLVLVVEDSP